VPPPFRHGVVLGGGVGWQLRLHDPAPRSENTAYRILRRARIPARPHRSRELPGSGRSGLELTDCASLSDNDGYFGHTTTLARQEPVHIGALRANVTNARQTVPQTPEALSEPQLVPLQLDSIDASSPNQRERCVVRHTPAAGQCSNRAAID
jgi:hypothetical protein